MVDDEEYPVWDGVVMRPGTEVFCDDRDHAGYDCPGVLTSVRRTESGRWEYEMAFYKPDGSLNAPELVEGFTISPDPGEHNKPEARAWRAQRMLRVFLCHGSEDKPTVRQLHQDLLKAGMRPWLDEIDIEPGAEWDEAIRKAVREADIVLVCLSSSSVTKTGYLQKEIKFALDRAEEKPDDTTYIIPIRFDDCPIPRRLQQWQAVSLDTPDGRRRLFDALRKHAVRVYAARA